MNAAFLIRQVATKFVMLLTALELYQFLNERYNETRITGFPIRSLILQVKLSSSY